MKNLKFISVLSLLIFSTGDVVAQEKLTYLENKKIETTYTQTNNEGIYENIKKGYRLIRDKYGNVTEFGYSEYEPSSMWLPETDTLRIKQKYKSKIYYREGKKLVANRRCKIRDKKFISVGAGEFEAWFTKCKTSLYTNINWIENIWITTDPSRTLLKLERISPQVDDYKIELIKWEK